MDLVRLQIIYQTRVTTSHASGAEILVCTLAAAVVGGYVSCTHEGTADGAISSQLRTIKMGIGDKSQDQEYVERGRAS
jgi:hypothetical protein